MEGETERTLHKFPKEIRVSKRDFSKQLCHLSRSMTHDH